MPYAVAIPGLDEFLNDQPFISIQPSNGNPLLLEGDFQFCAEHEGHPRINDTYNLQISIPRDFPRRTPTVTEIGGRIPRVDDFHVNGNGTLCLGSRIRLMARLQAEPTIQGFSKNCIVPYLYAMSLKLTHGQDFIFGELRHGVHGELDDYKELLGLKRNDRVVPALLCLLKKKRLANKMPCPCGCKKRLGKCDLNVTVRKFRSILPKAWLREVVTGKR
ncbi:MAG: hypothetical protein IAE94_10925 [Chthoniobacterales bacterium]|nr:hypothetical protein [Chthoniobacterales bacterium]